MRKKGTPVVLAVSLAVLAAAWLLAESTAGRLGTKEEAGASGERESVPLSAGRQEDIRALSWVYEEKRVSLEWEEEEERWIQVGDPACPVDPLSVEALVAAAANVRGGMRITGVKDFAQYGLEEPALTVVVETEDNAVTYEVGNRTITGEYYLRLDETDTVYTGEGAFPESFQVGLEDLLAVERAPEDIAAPKALHVTGEGENYSLQRQEEGDGAWYSGAYEWYVTREGDTSPVSAEGAKLLWEQVIGVSFQSCVDWHEENFARYGLDMPQVVVEAVYLTAEGEEKTFSLRFGDYAGEQIYGNMAGSDKVYLLSGAMADELMYPNWTAMTPLTVCPVNLEEVAGVTVAMGGHVYEMEVIRKSRQEVDTDGNLVMEETACYVANGWTLDENGAESWLNEVAGLTAESPAAEAQGREELLSVTFLPEDGTWPAVTLSLRSYDSTRCLCLVNETEGYFIARTRGEALVTAAEKLLMPE